MNSLATSAFQDARNALLSAQIQARLQAERGNSPWLDSILREEEQRSGYARPVPLVNQATFLAMLYSTALWLRETYFKDEQAKTILRKHVAPFVGNQKVAVVYGPKAAPFSAANAERFARRVRNALGHASLTIAEDLFIFKDVNSQNLEDWVEISMTWQTTGEYTIALISAGNELLYPEHIAEDAGS
jgi:hypothetical protein